MQQNDYDRFTQILSACADMYNQRRPSEFVIGIWWSALKDYDMKSVQEAFSAHVKNPDNGQFMPKPADIIRLIGGTNTDKALVAWTMVNDAVRRVGTYSDVRFEDSIIHTVITDMGGWISLGNKTDKEWDFVKNEFVTRYRSISAMPYKPVAPDVLIGIANMTNAQNGFPASPAVYIGSRKQEALTANRKALQ